ncbi:MAG: hypothetical protein A2289_13935 [Deltaproteobacteria bacterium RIFOXYA12_FULL_58_15]|nr:MAG: hypothetical protein A2289_13935 [Deltaproteobacteria bacterium RIFOXYA12_FULL_58_15]OGR07651.1 MAG: hypothetical protein A2341_21675 [Deltaproteobacteria bacterium RIFOXYB12_FULL_58_9]
MHSSAYVSEDTIEAKSHLWLDRIRQAVAPRPQLQLDLSRSALLVIDMLRYFAAARGRCYLPATAAIVPRIAKLIKVWRHHGALVVYTQHCHKGAHDLGMLGRFFSDHIDCNEPQAQIIGALEPLPSEPIFRKITYDAFLGTQLESTLRQKKVEQVLITGVLTHMCCDTTARAAFCRGFEVYVPVDATASSTEELHVGALLGLADSVAIPMSTVEILTRCPTKA